MNYETLTYNVSDEVATITLNRPNKLNAYTPQMGAELIASFRAADADPAVRAVILTGNGRAFCAGADIGGFAQDIKTRDTGDDGSRRRVEAGLSLPSTLRNLSKPTIAALNGFALGVGCTITLLCDIRIAAEQAKIGLIFSRVGLVAELGSSYLLPRLIGFSRAAEMMLTGKQFTAAECLAMGLVSHVTPGDQLLAKARELTDEIRQCSPTSLAYTRRALHLGLEGNIESAMQFEGFALEKCYSSAEHKEYVSAFLEKRKPNFSRVAR